MYRRSNDPRLRRRLNELSQTFESANESSQAALFTFSRHYLNPCFSSLSACFASTTEPCTACCLPGRDERRRPRNRRGRAETGFDFYDDWEEDSESDGLLGWGNDELDRLLAGSGGYGTASTVTGQPQRQRAMSYGAGRKDASRLPGGRRKNAVQLHDGGPDPTIIPNSSFFGFMGRLPWKFGSGKGLRYKPSAADLQEHPGGLRTSRTDVVEGAPLIEETNEDSDGRETHSHKRTRSTTVSSAHTTDSYSSRGDIFPSEDEDDAVPLDDEFAMVLERRTTQDQPSENSSGKGARRGKRPSAGSRMSTRTMSSRSTRKSGIEEAPPLLELKQEEERTQREEEEYVERRRDAAKQLAKDRGLSLEEQPGTEQIQEQTLRGNWDHSQQRSIENDEAEPPLPTSTPAPKTADLRSSLAPLSFDSVRTGAGTTPFPAFEPLSAFSVISPEMQNLGPPHSVSRLQEYVPVESSQLPGERGGESQDPGASSNTEFVPARLPRFNGGQG
ncbi:hypothetical protein BJ546DRAFT_851635 [Cryomyces antarcticus]